MNKPIDEEKYIEYKDKRFTLSNYDLAILQDGVPVHIYFVAEKVNNFIVAGVKLYNYDKVTKKLIGGKTILTTGLN